MKQCPFCGANIEDSARFCLYCMQSLTEKEQILPRQKKMPQWLLPIAAIGALSVILMIIISGKTIAPESNLPSEELPLNSTATTSQTEITETTELSDTTEPSEPSVPTEPSEPSVPTEPSEPSVPTEPSHIHNFSVKNTATKYQKNAATCITSAIFYYSCACGEKGAETFPYGETAAHTVVTTQGHPATCKTQGLTDGTHCSVCNTVFSSQVQIPVIGHTYDNDQDGQCNVCDHTRVLNCNHAKTVKLTAVSPTCTAGGLTEGKKCSLCDEILTAQTTLAPLEHMVVTDQAIAPTCTTNGKSEGKHCAACNAVLVYQQHISATGHSFDSNNTSAPCSVCGAQPPHIHTYSEENTAAEYLKEEANCLNPATYYYSCACGEKGSKTFTYGNITSHTWVTIPGDPATCTSHGTPDKEYCTVCQESTQAIWELPIIGHTFMPGDSLSACTVCGEMGSVIFHLEQTLPLTLNDKYLVTNCYYKIQKQFENRWEVFVYIDYINLTSTATFLCPDASIRWYTGTSSTGSTGSCNASWVKPNESGTCRIDFGISNAASEYYIILE